MFLILLRILCCRKKFRRGYRLRDAPVGKPSTAETVASVFEHTDDKEISALKGELARFMKQVEENRQKDKEEAEQYRNDAEEQRKLDIMSATKDRLDE
jgi:hypothetical protein